MGSALKLRALLAILPLIALAPTPPHAEARESEARLLADTVASASLAGSYLAGQVAAKANDDEAAVSFFRRSLALDPANAVVKEQLFQSLIANGRIGEAVGIARDNLQLADEGNIRVLILAVDAVKQGEWDRVGELLSGASASELDNIIDQLLTAWARFGAGDKERAVENASGIVGADWVSAIASYHAGLMAAAAGDHAKAAQLFSVTTENRGIAGVLTETYLRAVEGQAISQALTGSREAALATIDTFGELAPNHLPFAALRELIQEGGTPTILVSTAQQGAAEVFYNVGGAIGRQGGNSMAQGFLQFASYLDPDSESVAIALANLFERQKQLERANDYYRKVDPNSVLYRRARIDEALNLNDLERADEAKAILRELIAQDPDDLIASLTLGGVLSQHKEYLEASQVYEAAAARLEKVEAKHWNLFYRRGIAYERLKQWEKAEADFRKALELDPEQPDVLNYLGYSLVDMGMKLDEAMDMIRRAVELKPRSGYIIDSLGWAYYRIGQYDDAVRELERAIELMPQDPVVNDHLGDAYWQVGRHLEAVFQWRHALDSKPEPAEEAKIRMKLVNGLPKEPDRDAAAISE